MLVTRFAPTPSGYLHAGNVVNALLTSWLAQACGGRMLLRIDDFDAARIRPEYVEDVFATIQWLGLPVWGGPRDAADFAARFALPHLRPRLAEVRDGLLRAHPDAVFTCTCSRRDLSEGYCARGCRGARIALRPGESLLRLHVPLGTEVTMRVARPLQRPGPGGRARAASDGPPSPELGKGAPAEASPADSALPGPRTASVPVPSGDHVLWRREDLPAYHLGSIVVDQDLEVTAIVRGIDLAESSALQVHLAGLLGAAGPASAIYLHHGLITAADGTKLSKSAGAQAQPLPHDHTRLAALKVLARAIGMPLGIHEPSS